MKIPFRQGIVRYQTDTSQSPSFLYREISGNYISLYVSPISTIITFAHGDVDYLLEESCTIIHAWGPFVTGNNYYLYWDINVATGMRTFGYTNSAPLYGSPKPVHPVNEQHWFDLNTNTMFYWSGMRWVECIRVFAGSYLQGANLYQNIVGSQIGNNTEINAGFILFDDNEKPVRRARLDGKGKFLTTESQFYSDKAATTTVSFETVMHYATAREDLAAWNIVTYVDADGIGLASNLDIHHRPAFGLLREGLPFGSIGAIVTKGYVTNLTWNWTEAASTILYLGPLGTLQVNPPGIGFIQQIATIVSPNTIFVNIEPQIIHYDSVQNTITIPIEVDLLTGKLTTSPQSATITHTIGLTYTQTISSTEWLIPHNHDTINFITQIHDELGDLMWPDNARYIDSNHIKIYFTAPTTGTAQVLLIKH
jgi:hypothetical protein